MRLRLPLRGRRAAIGALISAVLAGIVAISFGPCVRGKAASAARARGFEITIAKVRPAWFGATLEGVELRPEGVTTVVAHIDDVRVDVSLAFSPKEVSIHGGSIDLTGPTAIDDLIAWRERRPKSDAPSGARLPITVDALAAHWTGGEIDLDAEDIGAHRDNEGLHLETKHAKAKIQDLSIDIGNASADFDRENKLALAHADTADFGIGLAEKEKPEKEKKDDPDPPAAPIVKRPGKQPPQPYGPIFVLPDLHDLRARVRAATTLLAARTTSDANADVRGVSLAITRGADRVEIGPGSFSLVRSSEAFAIDFASRAAPNKPPLSLSATLPIASGDLIAELSGGPVTLALFGIKEGQMGLTDVDRATIGGAGQMKMTDAGDLLRFDGRVSLKDISIRHDAIASDTVRGLAIEAAARGSLGDTGALELDEVEAHTGSLHLRAKGRAEQAPDHLAVELAFELPAAGCESLRNSLPTALLPVLERARYKGTLAAKGAFAFDTRDLDALVLRYEFDDRCKLDVVPDVLERDTLEHPFRYWALDRDAKPIELESGPGTERWTPLDEISPFMQVAVLTTEDGLFYKHKGFNHAAMRQSLIANLKAHKFIRGASTITMQLAKNLYLSREKTLARKLQEIVLADALEKTLSKEDMMELYLNVIEFGPDIYGVGAAAEHYFGRTPAELNLAECLFLSSLLPQPRTSHKIFEKGEVPQAWMKTIHAWMDIAEKSNKITAKEHEEAAAETIVFYKEGDARPVARPAVRAPVFKDGRDGGWE